MFNLFKKNDDSQPRQGSPWVLTLGAYPGPRSNPSWTDIESGLKNLIQDGDSFLILEQKDPANPKRYWFIQCAIALQGPCAGQYSLEVGYKGADGKGHLLDQTLPRLDQVLPYFNLAFSGKKLDLSGFEDMSDMVQ